MKNLTQLLKKLVLPIIPLLLITFNGFSYPSTLWGNTFGGSENEIFHDVKTTPDGGCIAVGVADDQALIVRYNASGNVLWQKELGQYEGALSVAPTYSSSGTHSGYVIGVFEDSYNESRFRVIRMSLLGSTIWSKSCYYPYGFLVRGSGFMMNITQVNNGDIVVSGNRDCIVSSTGIRAPACFAWIKRLSLQNGQQLWEDIIDGNILNGQRFLKAELSSLVSTVDGGFIAAGKILHYSNNALDEDIILLKYDANGNRDWLGNYTASLAIGGSYVVEDPNGGYAFATTKDNLVGAAGFDLLFTKLNSQGHIQYQQTYGNAGVPEVAKDLVTTPDGGFVIGGISKVQGEYRYHLRKIDASGNQQWVQPYGGALDNLSSPFGGELVNLSSPSIDATYDGFYICGKVDNEPNNIPTNGQTDAWASKLYFYSLPYSLDPELISSQCGGTVSSMGTLVCNIPGANEYSLTLYNYQSPYYANTATSRTNTFHIPTRFPGMPNGDYTVNISAKMGNTWYYGDACVVTVGNNLRLARNVTLQNLESYERLSIYPNPSNANNKGFNIDFSGLTSELNQIQIKVVDLFGKEVYSRQITHNNEDLRERVDFREVLASGIYLVNINVNGESFNQKLQVK